MCIVLTPSTTSSHNTTLAAQNIDKHYPPKQINSPMVQNTSPFQTTPSIMQTINPPQINPLNHTFISPLPTNPIDAIHDHNWKISMKTNMVLLLK